MKQLLVIMIILLIVVLANANETDVTHTMECYKIGLYDPKTGNCYLGPNDKAVQEMIALERRLKAATKHAWKWNHGLDKNLIREALRP